MHPIDKAIFDKQLTEELLEEYAAQPLPSENTSYWGDAMRSVKNPHRAAKIAAKEMGQAYATINS